MSDNQDALRLADECEDESRMNPDDYRWQAAAELRRLHAERSAADEVVNDLAEKVRRVVAENEALKTELAEQARINGMGSEREARLVAENDQLRHAMDGLTQRCVNDTALIGELVEALRGLISIDREMPRELPMGPGNIPARVGLHVAAERARAVLAKAGAGK